MAKFPEPPTHLASIPPTLVTLPTRTRVWRVYKSGGAHPTTWNAFRSYGPLPFRFDHHLSNPPATTSRGVLYAAGGNDPITTCLAEAYQGGRVIDRNASAPFLAGFELLRDVTFLDMTGAWPTAAGASTAIHSGQRPRARWSQAIYAAYPNVEGLVCASSMNGNDVAYAFYERAATAVGTLVFNRALNDPSLLVRIQTSAGTLGYAVV